MRLLLGTKNIAKIDEYKKYFLVKRDLQIVTLKELNISEDVEETGTTFLENALIKAKFYGEKSGMLTLAEDGGLEIQALNGKPGVYSRRWPGHKATDIELINYTLEKMKDFSENRQACIKALAIVFEPQTGQYNEFVSEINGVIINEFDGRMKEGFPYRSLFKINEYNKLFIDLNDQEQDKLNHRKKIVSQIIKFLNQKYA